MTTTVDISRPVRAQIRAQCQKTLKARSFGGNAHDEASRLLSALCTTEVILALVSRCDALDAASDKLITDARENRFSIERLQRDLAAARREVADWRKRA